MEREVLAKGRVPGPADYDIKCHTGSWRLVLNPKRNILEIQVSNRIQLVMDRTENLDSVKDLNARIAELRKASLSADEHDRAELSKQIQALKDEVMIIIKREMKQNYPFDERKRMKYKIWNRLTNEAFHIRERVL